MWESCVEQGQTLEPGEHQEVVLYVKETSCYVEGYTGDTYCSVCNIKLAEEQLFQSLNMNMKIMYVKIRRINNA